MADEYMEALGNEFERMRKNKITDQQVKAGETECIYAIDEKDKMYGVVVSYGNKE